MLQRRLVSSFAKRSGLRSTVSCLPYSGWGLALAVLIGAAVCMVLT
jgi:hypothetical protein